MLTAEQIQGAKLKRTNVSVDPAKTKQRAEELLRHAKIATKQAIRELADISPQVFHGIYSKGSISIRMVIAVSQTLNVSPFFITGEADERGEFSVEALRDLLLKHKYRDLAASLGLPEKRKRRAKLEETAAEDAQVDAATAAPLPAEPQLPPASDVIDEADLHLLLSAVAIQAKAGIPAARERMDQIKRLLLA
jgi:hypothetical protein